VEALTLHDANELLAYWSEHPPAHLLLAALIQARPSRASKPVTENDLASAVAALGGSVRYTTSRELKNLLAHESSKSTTSTSSTVDFVD